MWLWSLDPHPYEAGVEEDSEEHPLVGDDPIGPRIIGAVDEEHLGEVTWMR